MAQETSILKNRIKKVRAKLLAEKIDALIVTAVSNVSYLSGFQGEDSWLLITADIITLLTDSRYTLAAQKQCPLCKIYERKGRMTESIGEILKKNSKVKIAGVEDKIEVGIFKILKRKLPIRLKAVKNIVESVRQIKDESEISAIKKAGAVAEKSLEKVLTKIRIGMSEMEIAAMIDFEIKKAGANPSFETIVALGSNAAMAHHRPTTRKLKKVDTILIDYGAKLNGYCCDLTRCFAVGKVNKYYAKVYKAVLDAQTAAINILKAGVDAKIVDACAKEVIKLENLPPYGHGLGHGLGIDVHEQPAVSYLSKNTLQNGNVITVEPGVYLDGKFGIRIEDDVLVTKTGCEVLTTLLKSEQVPLLRMK